MVKYISNIELINELNNYNIINKSILAINCQPINIDIVKKIDYITDINNINYDDYDIIIIGYIPNNWDIINKINNLNKKYIQLFDTNNINSILGNLGYRPNAHNIYLGFNTNIIYFSPDSDFYHYTPPAKIIKAGIPTEEISHYTVGTNTCWITNMVVNKFTGKEIKIQHYNCSKYDNCSAYDLSTIPSTALTIADDYIYGINLSQLLALDLSSHFTLDTGRSNSPIHKLLAWSSTKHIPTLHKKKLISPIFFIQKLR